MSGSPLLYTSGEVRRLVGVSQRQLTYWDESALVRPSGRIASGRGSRRLFTVLDVLQLKLICRLKEAGLPLQRVRRALLRLATLSDEVAPVAELEVLTDGQRILVRRSGEHLLDPLANQYVLRLPLADLLAEVGANMLEEVSTGRRVGDRARGQSEARTRQRRTAAALGGSTMRGGLVEPRSR